MRHKESLHERQPPGCCLKIAQNGQVGVSFWWSSGRLPILWALFLQHKRQPMTTQIQNCRSAKFALDLNTGSGNLTEVNKLLPWLVTAPVPFGKIVHAVSAHVHCAAGLVEVDTHLSGTDSGAAHVNTPPTPLSVPLPPSCKFAIMLSWSHYPPLWAQYFAVEDMMTPILPFQRVYLILLELHILVLCVCTHQMVSSLYMYSDKTIWGVLCKTRFPHAERRQHYDW